MPAVQSERPLANILSIFAVTQNAQLDIYNM